MNARPCAPGTRTYRFHSEAGDFRKGKLLMNDLPDRTLGQRIDLMRETDVAYWCRIFDVTIDQLREAVRHVGHQVGEVRRYLSRQPPV